LYFLEKESASDARTSAENRFLIPARLYRFKPDEPERGDLPARSLSGKPKHAGIQSRMEGGQCAGFLPVVSREAILNSSF